MSGFYGRVLCQTESPAMGLDVGRGTIIQAKTARGDALGHSLPFF